MHYSMSANEITCQNSWILRGTQRERRWWKVGRVFDITAVVWSAASELSRPRWWDWFQLHEGWTAVDCGSHQPASKTRPRYEPIHSYTLHLANQTAHTHTTVFYGSMDFVRDNLGEPVPEETFTHSTPIMVINCPLSALSVYYDPWHPPCSIHTSNSLFPQSHSKFSLLYLLAWHPPLHILYISSPNHWLIKLLLLLLVPVWDVSVFLILRNDRFYEISKTIGTSLSIFLTYSGWPLF